MNPASALTRILNTLDLERNAIADPAERAEMAYEVGTVNLVELAVAETINWLLQGVEGAGLVGTGALSYKGFLFPVGAMLETCG